MNYKRETYSNVGQESETIHKGADWEEVWCSTYERVMHGWL